VCSKSCLHGVGLPKSLKIGRNGPRSECNLRLLYIYDNSNNAERQPLVFVPEDGLDETGTINVSYDTSTDFYLEADLESNQVSDGTWCVDSETIIYTNSDYEYTILNPCEDNIEDIVGEERYNNHYADIDWHIISYIINNYDRGDVIECPVSGDTYDITTNGIQFAIWSFTNPGEYNCPVDNIDEDIECDSGCAIVNEVKQVFWISE